MGTEPTPTTALRELALKLLAEIPDMLGMRPDPWVCAEPDTCDRHCRDIVNGVQEMLAAALHASAAREEELRKRLAFVTSERDYLFDLPLCRLQLPDGTVPGCTEEALKAWHDVARDALQQVRVLQPGGTYAWRERAERSEAQSLALRTEVTRLTDLLASERADAHESHWKTRYELAADAGARIEAKYDALRSEGERLRTALTGYVAILLQPSDQSAFGLETSWLIYDETRAQIADELIRIRDAALHAPSLTPQLQEAVCGDIRGAYRCDRPIGHESLHGVRGLTEWADPAPRDAPATTPKETP